MVLNKYEKFLIESVDKDTEDSDLLKLFYQLFNNSNIYGIEIEQTGSNAIEMYFSLNERERLRDISKILDILSKIKKDILPQFESTMDLYIAKSGKPELYVLFEIS